DARGVQLVEAATGKELGNLAAGNQVFVALAFSPDGRTLAASASDFANGTTIYLFERASGTVRWTYSGHKGRADQLAYSPDGRMLASAGGGTTVLLWDLHGTLLRAERPPAWTEKELAAMWGELAETDGRRAFAVLVRLSSVPDRAVAWVRQHQPPAATLKADPEHVAKLLADLDDEK